MTAVARQSLFWKFWGCIFSRPYLQITLLCALGCLAEGRARTLKRCGRNVIPLARIVGGKFVQHGQYPWMVSVQEQYHNFRHVCGGAILNEHYIITAAHCIDYPTSPWRYEIYAGLHQLSGTSSKTVKKYEISRLILHKDYNEDTFENDIALLRTKDPIDFKGSAGYINGICLPYSSEDPKGSAFVAGWGHTREDGENSDVLQAVKVPLVSRGLCFEAYDEDPYDASDDILDTQICAGKVNKDSCQNDSGGPLVQQDDNGIYTLIGIVSYGTGCGSKDYPGVYTKVASYMDWLDKQMDQHTNARAGLRSGVVRRRT